MKNLLFLLGVFVFTITTMQAQTEGISYQAVILNPDAQQLPGADLPNMPLAEAPISLRFTIKNEDGSVAYQEILDTQTDAYGMINVFIGMGVSTNGSAFDQIDWNGTYKSLAVELDTNLGRGFIFLSEQPLPFTPQAYHRNIIADGDLTVEGTAIVRGDFEIEGQTTIGSDLEIDGDLEVTEDLSVGEDLNVGEDIVAGDDLTVNGVTQLNNLTVRNTRPTLLTGTLEVDGFTTINSGINVVRGATFGQNINVAGNAAISGNHNTGGNHDVVGRQIIGGNQTIGGLQIVAGDQRVGGMQTISLSQRVEGGQDIKGNQNVDGNSDVGGNFILSGSANVGQSILVGGTADVISRLTVGGEANLLGRLNVNSVTTIGGSMEVSGFTFIDDNFGVANNISSGGSLDVTGKATVLGDFSVSGIAKFNNAVKVDGGATVFLTGPFTAEGLSRFGGGINIDNGAPSVFSGMLTVNQDAIFDQDVLIDGMLTVNNNLNLSGLVVSGSNTTQGNHIALFENTAQSGADGIAIKIDDTTLNEENQFVTFYGEGDYVAGRIESFSIPNGMTQNAGIVYGSTGADYAEWLEKEDPTTQFRVGEVVGVKAGKISRNTSDVDHILTISLAPIVLGNMPEENKKENFEKVGFMGQVPALVKGKVNRGDYIIASGNNDGYAIAVPEGQLQLKDLKRVIGKAWSDSQETESLINVSVGLKSNEWVEILNAQELRIKALETKLESINILSDKMKTIEAKLNAIDMN